MVPLHSIRVGILALATMLLAWPTGGAGQQVSSAAPASSGFTIFLRAMPVGTEQVSLERTPDGWMITGRGQIGPPFDLVTRSLRVRYDLEWRPRELAVDLTARGQVLKMLTTVTGTTAESELTTNGTAAQKVDTLEESAVLLLPGSIFAPYEAVAVRLKAAAPGTRLPVHVASQGSVAIIVGESVQENIQTLARLINARRTKISLERPGGLPPLDAEVWGDEAGRLLRVSVPAQSLDAVRDDVGSVSARHVTVVRAGDEQVRIPANGFSLAGTISKPAGAGGKPLPAVVLVGGSGLTDRDETISGIPIFGQLANALADAGYLVLRYDKRAVGQSGGRAEAATLADFAEDLRAAVRFISNRKDVDRRRLAVVGHSEGGAVGLLAADRENRIAALVLIAAPGMTGADLNLAQVTRALAQSNRPEAEKQATIELQKKIQTAVLTGNGWDELTPALRQQADIPWFRSFLTFDPVRIMRDVEQPILVVQPLLDAQVPPVNADRLEAAARARKKPAPIEVVRLPGLNHLLVPATTGEPAEYGALTDRNVSPAVAASIAGWLRKIW
jgi:pimeloyl-ACP methyl ester carboxylesterase